MATLTSYSKLPTSKQSSPTLSLKSCLGRQTSQEPSMETSQDLPLPDVVLCSSLAANIAHSRRQEQEVLRRSRRQRHPATIQTPARIKEFPAPDVDPDTLMEPLVRSMETISLHPAVEDTEAEAEVEAVERKRRRTTSASEAAVLSTISRATAATITRHQDNKISDTGDGSFVSAVRGFISTINNIFSH